MTIAPVYPEKRRFTPLAAPGGNANICGLLANWAETSPDKPALIISAGESLTYHSLYQIVQNAASFWQGKLDAETTSVALLLGNSLDFVIHYLALLGLGHTVIPLNTRLTWDEIMTILADAECGWIVSSSQHSRTLSTAVETANISLVLSETKNDITNERVGSFKAIYHWHQDNTLPSAQVEGIKFPKPVIPNTVATIIYTSGTTGRPKGVMLSHLNILSDAWGNVNVVEANENDVFITISPLFHVFGQTNVLLSALMAGATLVLLNAGTPTQILEAIEKHQVTFMAAVPTMYRTLLGVLKEQPYNLSSLRVCHSGAAPMGVTLFHEIETIFNAPVQEGYGLSEASSIVTSNPLRGTRKPGSIGMGIPGVQTKITDENSHTLPPFEVGEVCVLGNTVMLGYWKQPELTQKAFLADGWLKTGDMGYQDEDGYIFLLDRRDDLINVGGVKVYPREIEEVLYQHPAVLETVVVGQTSEHYTHTVAAFVVLRPGHTVTAREIKRHCSKKLAPYKIPQNITFLDALPKGPTGKLLRKSLRNQRQEPARLP